MVTTPEPTEPEVEPEDPGIRYHDGSNHPQWPSKVVPTPALTAAVQALGFERLGVLVASADTGPENFEGEDQALIRSVDGAEAVFVWRTPDALVYAVPSPYFGGDVLMFRSVLSDGAVVETVTRPARAPNVVGSGWFAPPLWPRHDLPAVGFLLELVAGAPEAVFARHRERLASFAASRGASPVPFHDMDRVVRTSEVVTLRAQGPMLVLLRWMLVFMLVRAGLSVALPIVFCGGGWWTGWWWEGLALAGLSPLVLRWLARGLVGENALVALPWAARRVTGPPPEPF